MTIREANSPVDLDDVRQLLRTFIDWHRERHRVTAELVDQYFDPQAFEVELANLPGDFSPPRGRLLLAHVDGTAAGCVGLRDLGAGICEMKRMFIYPARQRQGIGRLLVESIVSEARNLGYRLMRLDTSVGQTEAQHLYRSEGFVAIPPYYPLPEDMQAWLVFMELDLT